MNLVVTLAHIALLLAFTITSMLNDIFTLRTYDAEYRSKTAFIFISGVLDIFVACMMWFIVDEDGRPDFVVDERTRISYPIEDVLSNTQSDEHSDTSFEI